MIGLALVLALVGYVANSQPHESDIFRQRDKVVAGVVLSQHPTFRVNAVNHVGRPRLSRDRLLGRFVLNTDQENEFDLLFRVLDGVNFRSDWHHRTDKDVHDFARKYRGTRNIALWFRTDIVRPAVGWRDLTARWHRVEAHEAPCAVGWHRPDVLDLKSDADERATAINPQAGFDLRIELEPRSILSDQRVEFLSREIGLPSSYAGRNGDDEHARDSGPERNPIIPVAVMILAVAAIAWGLWGLLLERPQGAKAAATHGLATIAGYLGLSGGTLWLLVTLFQT